jgi:hypothetical protein
MPKAGTTCSPDRAKGDGPRIRKPVEEELQAEEMVCMPMRDVNRGRFRWCASIQLISSRVRMLIEPGVRTGKFRLDGDRLIRDEQGKSWVSFEDYAVALVDELEKSAHERSRFTIGY